MSIDGASYCRLSLPSVSFPVYTKRLSSPALPLRAYNFTPAAFYQAVSFQCHPRFCTYFSGLRHFHTALLHVSIGSALYGVSFSHPGSLRKLFQVCSRKQKSVTQRLNSYNYDKSFDLESQILDFMDQSDRPDLFPSRSELLRAGRSDLVEAILAKGGWMVAGWDLELGIEEEQAERLDDLGLNSIAKPHTEDSSKVLDDLCTNRREELGFLADITEVSPHTLSRLERQKGWGKVADLFGLSSTTKPEHDEKPLVLANQETPRTRPNGMNGASTHVQLGDVFNHGRRDNACQSQAGGNKGFEVTSPVIENKKKRRRKSTKTSSSSSTAQQTNEQQAWVTQSKNRLTKLDGREQSKENNVPISNRIRGLEAELVSTLDILKTERHALTDDIKPKQKNSLHHAELEEVSDALEFCETEIINKKRELRTARAQQTAFEGKLALDLMEFRSSMEEKDKRLEQAMQVLRTLRTARIVWANPAREVFLAGSYDGWASWRRMEKSNAGVFVTTLQLYPGQYEIKFIVDGAWRVDPNRPRACANGYENNVLTIF